MEKREISPQLFYRIGQVSRLTGIKPHVLRYWEGEFKLIRPRKDARGQRLYRRKDIDTILQIKDLLYNQRYSISGAKQRLKAQAAARRAQESPALPPSSELQMIINRQKRQIEELLVMLRSGS